MEIPTTVVGLDVNLTQGTSCLPPSRLVHAVATMVSDSKGGDISDSKGGDIFKNDSLKHLRNVAFPPQLDEKNLPTFDNASDLGTILPSKRNRSLAFSFLCNGYALRNRFDRLPVHRMCYYHSHEAAAVALRDLREEVNRSSARQ